MLALVAEPVPYPLAKRVLDKALSALLLLLLSPLILVVTAATILDLLLVRADRGPVLYRERRVSRGRTFALVKFRTLRRQALAQMRGANAHARLYESDPANLTWAGRRVLKPWYLDELPQLVNVLRGDISLVGPRPWPPSMVERQIADGDDYRNVVMAGLTGPAQVTKGAVGARYADLDRAYVELCRTSRGLGLVRHDLRILRRTLGVLARGEGLNY
jgi:lipopolysaccharide/colanic/teichoic acid biosynthesis glycosyltransferase